MRYGRQVNSLLIINEVLKKAGSPWRLTWYDETSCTFVHALEEVEVLLNIELLLEAPAVIKELDDALRGVAR